MKRLVILSLTLMVFSCQSQFEEIPFVKIEQFGSYKSYVYEEEENAQLKLSEYANLKDFYALGVLENHQGVLTIINSEFYQSETSDSQSVASDAFDQKANFFVSSVVELWTSVKIDEEIKNLEDLESFVLQSAIANDIDPESPFPFLLEGSALSLKWKVINRGSGQDKDDFANLHSEQKLGNEVIKVIGFFDKDNKHRISFGDQQINMHFVGKDGQINGQVDVLVPGERMTLKLPKRNF